MPKKTNCVIAVVLLCSFGIVSSANAQKQKSVEQIKAAIRSSFPDVQVAALYPASFPGWYEVVTPGELVYVNADATLLFAGRVLDIKTKKDLTAARWSEINSVDVAKLPLDLAIKSVRGSGERKLYVFADPDCPYCSQLEEQLVGVPDVTLYTFLLPLESIHPGATVKARQLWCAADRDAAWTTWMTKKVMPPAVSCEGDPIAAVHALAQELRINSTPTLFFANGKRLDGVVPTPQLVNEMDAAK